METPKKEYLDPLIKVLEVRSHGVLCLRGNREEGCVVRPVSD